MFGCRPPSLSCSSDKYQEQHKKFKFQPSWFWMLCVGWIPTLVAPSHRESEGDKHWWGWVARRNDNMKGCLPKGKCTLVCPHCARGLDWRWRVVHTQTQPPTALYNINLPPSPQAVGTTDTLPLLDCLEECGRSKMPLSTIGQRCWAVIARVDHDWRVKLVERHSNGRNDPTFRAEFDD